MPTPSGSSPAPGEIVNDAFWLQYAADHVTNAVKSRDDAAAKVDTYLAAIWTIYTGVLTAAVVFHQVSDNLCTLVLLALPVLILPIARYLCLQVAIPPQVEFYETSPESIRSTLYDGVLETKIKRLQWAKIGALVSAVSIAVSLFAFKLNDEGRKDFGVQTTFNAGMKGWMVSGTAEPDKDLAVSIAGNVDSIGKQKRFVYLEGAAEKSNADGSFLFMVPGDSIISDLKVIISWTGKDKRVKVIRN
jgi:hypothetical protein